MFLIYFIHLLLFIYLYLFIAFFLALVGYIVESIDKSWLLVLDLIYIAS